MPQQRIALGLEYDGSHFEGWQTQPHGRTLQDRLGQALALFTQQDAPSTFCAGRTDSGVHALEQVVHFDTDCQRDETSWVRGVNRFLPDSVAVRWARVVDGEFHARYSAQVRHYEYWILNQGVRAPLLAHRTGWVFRDLDVAAMQAAARELIGTHDFSSFRSAQCQSATPVRTLHRCDVDRVAPVLVRVRVSANAFLHHMVRNLVGALVAVGTGRHHSTWVGEILRARDRTRAAPTIEAAGLYLTGVEYDGRWGLPQARERRVFL